MKSVINTLTDGDHRTGIMNENELAYIAGAFDIGGRISADITVAKTARLNYSYEPNVQLSHPDKRIHEMLEELADELEIKYKLRPHPNRDSWRFEIRDNDSIRTFLDHLGPYLILQQEPAYTMVSDVLPAMEDGKQTTKEGFYELVAYAEILNLRSSRSPKYDLEFFYEEWGDDADLLEPREMMEQMFGD